MIVLYGVCGTNKATLGVKLLSAIVSAWRVNYGCLCTSMNTQWLLFCSILWKNLPSAPTCSHSPPHPPLTRPPPINWIHGFGEAWKKCLRFHPSSISYVASYNGYKILAIRLVYLYSESGIYALKHQGVNLSLLFKIGISWNAKYAIVSSFCKSDHICDLIWKTWNNPGRTEIQIMAWHESHTPALSRHINGRATNSRVCFHRHHFCDPVNSW